MANANDDRRFAARWVWCWPAIALLLLVFQVGGAWHGDGRWLVPVSLAGLLGVASAGWTAARTRSWSAAAAAVASVVIVGAAAAWPG